MQLKKISAIFLAAVLMLFSLATVAGAEDTKIFEVEVEALTTTSTLSSSPIIYSPGEEFTVKISAGQNTGITSVKFKIDYDETALEVVSDKCKANNLFTESDELTHKVSSTGDEYFLFYSDNYPKISTATGTFVELTFVAKEVCANNSAVSVSLFKNSDGFCVVQTASGSEVVPFVSNGDTFSIHDLDTENKIITPAKCLEDGYTTYSCKACNESVVGNVVPATGHNEANPVQENIVAPTCTVTGSFDSVVYCADCNAELSRENFLVNALGHDLVHHDAKAPTCTEIGWDAYDTCSRCDYTTYKELEALGHDYKSVVTEPTCTEKGYTTHTCTRCDDTYVDTYVDALNHDLIHHEAKAPTCTEIGWDAYNTCSRCDYTTYEELEALGHDYEAVVTEPTCTEKGYTTHTCTRCDDTYVDTEVEALGHKYGETTVVKPQYKVEGYSTHTCTVCGYVEKFDITPALPYPIEPSLVKEDGIWYYTVNGAKSNATTLVNYYGVWYYVEKGKVNWKCDTLCNYGGTWYYVKNGKVDWKCDTLCKYGGTWYYAKNGKVDWKSDTLCNYGGTWYYAKNGKVDWKCNTLCNYGGTWYYVKNGKVDWNCNTLCKYGNTWYYVQKGKVNWNATTLCKYGNTWYYVEKGKVNFKATLRFKYYGTYYNVRNGVVRF